MISSNKQDDSYNNSLLDSYRKKGFYINNIKINENQNRDFFRINEIVSIINSSFKKDSCLILSYPGCSIHLIIASLFVENGNNPRIAVERVTRINPSLLFTEDDISFINKYEQNLSMTKAEDLRNEVENLSENNDSEFIEDDESILKLSPGDDSGLPLGEDSPECPDDFGILEEPVISSDSDSDKIIENEKDIETEDLFKKDKKQNDCNKELSEVQIPSIECESGLNDSISSKEISSGNESDDDITDMPETRGSDNSGRRGIFSSLRFKLISIISIIVIVALTVMIFLATYFFKKDNLIRAEENNHEMSKIISLKVKSDFESIIEKSRFISDAMVQRLDPKLYFRNNRDFVFFGIAVKGKRNTIKYISSAYNTKLMNETQTEKTSILKAGKLSRDVFLRSFSGETVVHNISPVFQSPVIGMSIPFEKTSNGKIKSIFISFIKTDKYLGAFKTKGIIKTFMVNDRGDIIAHPDGSIVVSGGNYLKLPIVTSMIKSTMGNNQIRYKDENGIFHLGSFWKIGIGGCGVIATVEESKAFAEVYNIQKRNLYLVVIVLTLVILVVYFFTKTITSPIIELVTATKRIKEGDYDVEIKTSTKDEIGELTESFVEMGKGLKERENMKDAFGKFVNKDIAEKVLQGEVQLGGERKIAAIFFSDIRSFTAISEKLEPEEVVEFLNEYMTLMVQCVNRTNGVVDKYIGDAIMAEWGVPISHGNDTENAVNAALMMRTALVKFNSNRGGVKKPIIKIGCGINTGPVLAGQIGSDERMEYTVIGDAVNLASRIEALNKPFGTDILISEDSYNLVRDIYSVEKMSPIMVKGKEAPQQIFAVLGRLDDPGRPQNIEEVRTILGIELQELKRRKEDNEREVKYEIIE